MKTTAARKIDNESERETHSKQRVKKSDFRHHLFIESYGVKIKITSNTADGIEDARNIVAENLPKCFREIEGTIAEHQFILVRNRSEKDSLYKNGEKYLIRTDRKTLLNFLGSSVRITVAEFAVGRVFVHAGVVSWKGKAIMIPGKSFSGKTTLTAALIKRGALYYSDEYAVLDDEGFVQTFPKMLSIRGVISKYAQVEYPVEKLGGTAAKTKTRVGMILISEYKPFAKWNPQILKPVNGIMELIKNTVSVRNNPTFALNVLNKIVNRAVIVKTRRGDVSKSVDQILGFFEKNCF